NSLASKGVGEGGGDTHVNEMANHRGIISTEMDDTVVFRSPLQLTGVFLGRAFHQNTLFCSHHAPTDLMSILGNAVLENGQALLLDVFGGVVRQLRGGRARAAAVNKAKRGIKPNVMNQVHSLLEIFVGFAWKANDEVGGDADVRANVPQALDLIDIVLNHMAPLHCSENTVGTALHR